MRVDKDASAAVSNAQPRRRAVAWPTLGEAAASRNVPRQDDETLIKELTHVVSQLKVSGPGANFEEDLREAVTKCVKAGQEVPKPPTVEEKLAKKLKGEFIFHGLKPLYTVAGDSVQVDDISHKGWINFSALVWGFHGRKDGAFKAFDSFKPGTSTKDTKEWKPKVKRTSGTSIHLIRTLSWESLQKKAFERRDLLVIALTETVEELQRIFLCGSPDKEANLREWLGISDEKVVSWTSNPNVEDAKATAAYAICLCLERDLLIDVNAISTKEDYTTINNRRYGKEKENEMY